MDSPILCADCGFPLSKEEALAACFGGATLCTECRARHNAKPVKMLRADGSVDTEWEGLEAKPHPMCKSTALVTHVPKGGGKPYKVAKPGPAKPKAAAKKSMADLERLVRQLEQADADLDYEIATGMPATKTPRKVVRKVPPLNTATWKQKGGETIKLSQMTASHIWFSIRMLERQLRKFGGGHDPLVSERLALLYRERERRLRQLAPKPLNPVTLAAAPGTGCRTGRVRYCLTHCDVDGHEYPAEVSPGHWQDWFSTAGRNRHVDFTPVAPGVEVLTVLTGIDHNFTSEGPPLIYETMVFGGVRDGSQWRCTTREEALALHKQTVNEVRAAEQAAKVEAAAQEAARAELVARAASERSVLEAQRAALEAAEAEAAAAKLRVVPKTSRFIKLGD